MIRNLSPVPAWLLLIGCMFAGEVPHVSHLDRNAVPRGVNRDLTLYGENLRNALVVYDDLRNVRIHEVLGDPRSDPNRLALQVEVPADTPLGYYGFRVVNEHGISNPMILLVDDLPTVLESTLHDRPETAQRLTWPSAVEGSVSDDQSDFYRIHANRGDRLSVEALAQRIGSPLDPLIRLLDDEGCELAWCDDDAALGPDARFAHRFDKSGDYLLEISDCLYKGGSDYRYRLRVGDFPLVTACYPPGGERGKEVQFELVGPSVDGLPRQTITFAPQSAGDEVIQNSVRRSEKGGSAFFRMHKGQVDEWLEAEPNDLPGQPQHVVRDAAINGRIVRPHDRDQYVFEATEGEDLELRGMTHTLGSPADLLMRLYDSADNQIAQSDADFDGGKTLRVRIPATGRYRLLVENLTAHGGSDYVYRIALGSYSQDYSVAAETAVFVMPQDGVLTVPVKVKRHFGFKGPIHFGLAGTVSGWNVLDSVPAGKDEGRIRIELPGDLWSGFSHNFYLSAWARVDGSTENWSVSHRAAVQRELNGLRTVPDNLLGALNAAIERTSTPAFELSVAQPVLKVEPLGKAASLAVNARRLGGFNGAIELRVRGLPAECEVRNATIAKGEDSAIVTVKLTEDTVGGSPQFEVLGLANVQGRGRKAVVSHLKLEIVRPR